MKRILAVLIAALLLLALAACKADDPITVSLPDDGNGETVEPTPEPIGDAEVWKMTHIVGSLDDAYLSDVSSSVEYRAGTYDDFDVVSVDCRSDAGS